MELASLLLHLMPEFNSVHLVTKIFLPFLSVETATVHLLNRLTYTYIAFTHLKIGVHKGGAIFFLW